VEKGSKGHSVKPIPNKMAIRMITNCDITLENVFVPDHNKLGRADDFLTGLTPTLIPSRLAIAWAALGTMAGAFEAAYNYAM
jgi:alkylation response protein AidB-like acyl-CoA dehydrogenase